MQPTDLQTKAAAVEFLSAFMREAAPTKTNPLYIGNIFTEAGKAGYTPEQIRAVLNEVTGYKSDLFPTGTGAYIRGYYRE